MPHDESWLSLLFSQGHEALLHWVHGFGHGWFFGSHVIVQHVLSILLVSAFILVFGIKARSQLEAAKGDILPDAKLSARTSMELLLDALLGLMQFTMPREAALKHVWLVGTLGCFILFSNLLGLVPGFVPPTSNLNTTFACGTFVFVYYNFYAFSKLGMGHLKHIANPVGEWWGWFLAPLFLPVELVSHCVRPCSLAIRLMCNIAGDHLVLGIFIGLFPLFLPIPFLALGLFVAIIQTFIFLLLSCVYIGEVEDIIAHHHEAHEIAQKHVRAALAG